MRCNGASLMAGGGAVCLNFDTGLMQNIIESLISGGDKLGGVQIHCSPYERWVNFRSGFTLSEVQWDGFLLNWLNLANPSGHLNANQMLMLNFSLSLKSHWQPCDSFMPVSEYRRMI